MFTDEIIIFCGPTGTGKSDAAICLAEEVNGEIINCDMAQIYSSFPIGTGQISEKNRRGIVHHLIGFLSVENLFSVYDMRVLIEKKIKEILLLGKKPILVGGSHFCIYALFFAPESFFENYYKNNFFSFKKEVFLQDSLEKLYYCPIFNYKIIVADVDIYSEFLKMKYEELLKFRIRNFMAEGWIKESKNLTELEKEFVIKKKFIGYDDILFFLNKKEDDFLNPQSYDILLERIFFRTRQYAKKQRTFIRKMLRDLSSKKEVEVGFKFLV